ncbi:MAG: PDZ domain-containing protein, partial [Pirellula sp.]
NERVAPPKLPASVKLESSWLDEIKWRSIGPANMSGRITDIAVHEKDTSLWWIATASGGLLKSTNHGGSMQHHFDREKVVSIGSIATDPNNKDVLWVGTGEINPRNSVSYGNGVYKTVDGGKTFQHLGLDRSYQIARILVDPKNSDTVYVGAAGRLYGNNPERGVYKTTDGGKTWQQVLYVDDQTGVIDMAMSPTDPNTIVVAMWDRMRDGFDSWPGSVPKPDGVDGYDPIRKWGKGGGIYRTTDGGANWTKVSKGLPPGMTGRIGLDWQLHSPNALYAIIDCEDIGKGPTGFSCYLGLVGQNADSQALVTQVMGDSPAAKAGIQVGDQLVSVEGTNVSEFDQLLETLRKKRPGQRIAMVLKRGQEEKSYDLLLTGRPGTPAQQTTVSLGITGEDKEDKIVVQRVSVGGSAAKAGIKIGDVITKIDGKAPGTFQSLSDMVQKKAEGDKLQFEIQRGEEKLELTVVLEARLGRGGGFQTPAQSNVYMGIQGEDASGGGATLTSVTEGGPAEKAGIKSGDIVLQIDGKEISNYEALVGEIRNHKAEDKLKVKLKRADQNLEVEVVLADRLSGGSAARPYTYSYFGQSPNVQDQQGADGYKYGGVYKSTDGGATWQRVNSLNTRPMYFSVVKVDPSDEKNLYVLGVAQHQSKDGGTIFTEDFGKRVHADGHDLWIDPADGRHMIIGCDGGVYVTYDRGATWDHINTAAIGQFYHVAISPKQPYWVAGGLQDNGSWAGPAISRAGGALNEDWVNLNGGDGFVCRADPNDPDLFYAESQNGAIVRRNLRTGERGSLRPARVDGLSYRFNWNTPFLLSSHNSKIFYTAGNYVFRSLDRGNDLRPISPEITLTQRGSATALSESPRDPNLLYAGTDDGALWVTRDGGTTWKNITSHLKLPNPRWVATIEASRHYKGRVYVCLDGHRSDDDNPYVFVSEDFGETFNPLHANLPWGSTRCLREDLVNPNLLYLGSEFAFWVSIDRGQNWTQFNQNLPTVAIHEVAIHPDNGEIVVATHGRSLWACDVSGLRQLKPENIGKEIALFDPIDVTRWRNDPGRGGTNRSFTGQNPSPGAKLWYALPTKAEKVVARVENIDGDLISEINAKSEPGLHMVNWDLTQNNRGPGGGPGGGGFGGGRGSGGGGGFGGGRERPDRPSDDSTDRPSRPTDDSAPRQGRQRRGRGDNPPDGAPSASEESSQNPNPNPNPPAQEESDAEAQQSATPPAASPPSGQGQASGGTSGGGATGGRAPQGFQGFRGARPVPNGVYRVQLIVDGKVIKTQSITINRDPNLPENAVADEVYELKILLDKQAKEDKYQNKSNGRGNYGDD